VSRASGATAEALHADGYANRRRPVNAGIGPHRIQPVLDVDDVKGARDAVALDIGDIHARDVGKVAAYSGPIYGSGVIGGDKG